MNYDVLSRRYIIVTCFAGYLVVKQINHDSLEWIRTLA